MVTRPALGLVWVCGAAASACAPTPDYESESFFPRNAAVEVDPSGAHFLHVTGFADGTLRIYRAEDTDLTLQKVFWSGVGDDPRGQDTSAALVRSPLFEGAWDVVLTADGGKAVVTGRTAHRVARLVKDAGDWQVRGEIEDGAKVPVEIPVDGAAAELLAGGRIRGLNRPLGLALSPDEASVYVAGHGDDAVAQLAVQGPSLRYLAAVGPVLAPRDLVALSTAGTSSSAGDDLLFVLGGEATACDADDTELVAIRRRGLRQVLLQQVISDLEAYTCDDAEDYADCLRDDVSVPGLIGGADLDWVRTASGADILLVSSRCQGTVTAFERRPDDLLQVAGTYRVIAPWEEATSTAEDGTITTLTATSASQAGLRGLEVYDGVVYVAANDGGFIAYFPLECLTAPASLADPAVCGGILCLDEATGCAEAPTGVARSVSAHPGGLVAADAVRYVTLDLEGQIAVLDLAPDGTPTLRYVAE